MSSPAATRRFPHEGRTALVTGAAVGIGREYARRLAADGARVVCADLNPSDETLELVRAEGSDGLGFQCDVSAPEEVAALREAVERFGGADIVVHNAGVYPLQEFTGMTFESWRRVLAINLDSLFLVAQAFVPTMIERSWGRLIAISSGMVHAGAPIAPHYIASKAGVIGLVRSLAGSLGPHGITVNAVSPGLVESFGTLTGPQRELGLFESIIDVQAIKRTGRPEDLAGMVSFLASDDASWMTGQTVLIDGGAARH